MATKQDKDIKLDDNYWIDHGNDADHKYVEDVEDKSHFLTQFQNSCKTTCLRHAAVLKKVLVILFLIGYSVYFGFAIAHSVSGATALIVITSLALFGLVYYWLKRLVGSWCWVHVCNPCGTIIDTQWYWLKWLLSALAVLFVTLYITLFVVQETRQLQSISGFVVFLFIPWITCKYPAKIKWRPVLWGIALQFLMGVVVLQWRPGYQAVRFIAREVNKFLGYSMEGAAATFGDPFFMFHPLIFIVMPLVVYLGAVLAILYYVGLTELIATKMAWFMQISMQISAVESMSLAANIFLSVLDTMLLLRPFMHRLTQSEFHTFLVGSHACIAGFAFGLFVIFGVSPQHLLTGAVMSAPAAAAIAKLNFPEVETSTMSRPEDVKLPPPPETNVVEAAANGAVAAAKSVMTLIVQILAFVSIYVFLNTTIGWLGARIGVELSFEIILSYVFMPLAFLMGVEWGETQKVGELLGVKIMFNEVLAYLNLGSDIREHTISERSATIATYAMCGFSSIGTLLMFIGVWKTIDPSRVSQVSSQLPRVFINANISCFLTACIAALFYNPESTYMAAPTASPYLNLLDFIPSYKELFQALPGI